MTAVALAEGVWLVGSGDAASPAFTNGYDCSQYLVVRDGVGLLVDCGTGLGTAAWLSNVAEVVPPASVAAVLVTHYHADHAGGAAGAVAAGLRVVGSRATAAALATADEEATSLARAREVGVYPAGYRLAAAACDVVDEGAGLSAGLGIDGVRLLSADGHCDGHLVLALDGPTTTLFSGDVVFAGGTVSIQALEDCRPARYARTLARLDAVAPDRLLPGHGPVVLTGAAADVHRAAAAFAALVPPPNVLQPPGYPAG
jgi:glyoxylase-like metal-dependent hydrolase (beta-lactamase superfamily II)